MLDDDLRRRLTARFGPRAGAWLDALPARADALAARWGVVLDAAAPLAGGSTSVVLRGRRTGAEDGGAPHGGHAGDERDGGGVLEGGRGDAGGGRDGAAVVLKLTPEPALARAEATALAAWAGGPVPLLLAHDDASGALLLEAIEPGRPLSASPTPPSPSTVGRLLRELAVPVPESGAGVPHGLAAPAPPHDARVPHGLAAPAPPHDARVLHGLAAPVPGAAGVGAGASRASWPGAPSPALPTLSQRVDVCFELWRERRAGNPVARATVDAAALERGHALARELAGDAAAPRALVHGDLHAGNVLDGGLARGLVAIDPRACVGDPGFDAVDLTLWGVETPAAAGERIAAVAALAGQERERLQQWCAALAAMAAASLASRPKPGTARRIETLLALAA